MNVEETDLPGVLILKPEVFGDDRGFFMETWNGRRYKELGIPDRFVQDNLSFSTRGVLRGLHFQIPPQGKLLSVPLGEVFDVAVDVRVGSPTFGRWTGAVLSSENGRQFWVPEGFAHGFAVTSETALLCYKCTEYYAPGSEGTVLWNDPGIGIEWPVEEPTLSGKDENAPTLAGMPENSLPTYEGV